MERKVKYDYAFKLECVKLVLEKGADINGANDNKTTGLIFASKESHLEIVKELIKQKIYIDAKQNDGLTALFYSSVNGSIEITTELITNGANVNIQDNEGYTPLILAIQNNKFEIAKLLLANKAKVNIYPANFESAFTATAKSGNAEIWNLLLKRNSFQFKDSKNRDKEIFHFLKIISETQELTIAQKKEFFSPILSKWKEGKEYKSNLHSTLSWFLLNEINSPSASKIFSKTNPKDLGNDFAKMHETNNSFKSSINYLLAKFYSLHKNFPMADHYLSLAVNQNQKLNKKVSKDKDFVYYKTTSMKKKKGIFFTIEQSNKKETPEKK